MISRYSITVLMFLMTTVFLLIFTNQYGLKKGQGIILLNNGLND